MAPLLELLPNRHLNLASESMYSFSFPITITMRLSIAVECVVLLALTCAIVTHGEMVKRGNDLPAQKQLYEKTPNPVNIGECRKLCVLSPKTAAAAGDGDDSELQVECQIANQCRANTLSGMDFSDRVSCIWHYRGIIVVVLL
jgi:hypothetical protein